MIRPVNVQKIERLDLAHLIRLQLSVEDPGRAVHVRVPRHLRAGMDEGGTCLLHITLQRRNKQEYEADRHATDKAVTPE
ncbi:hypothetical protein GCM10010350_79600 [Streptomyces galilaeus]|nr:hypothetical protein GCM10010350_79600 [Streptomyces galilaeus]